MLSTVVSGATSFEDIRATPVGILCAIIRQATARKGLRTDDSERHNVLVDAWTLASSKKLHPPFLRRRGPIGRMASFRGTPADNFRFTEERFYDEASPRADYKPSAFTASLLQETSLHPLCRITPCPMAEVPAVTTIEKLMSSI